MRILKLLFATKSLSLIMPLFHFSKRNKLTYLWCEVDCLAIKASTESQFSLDLHVVEDICDFHHFQPGHDHLTD